jgi:hypothetical protein
MVSGSASSARKRKYGGGIGIAKPIIYGVTIVDGANLSREA